MKYAPLVLTWPLSRPFRYIDASPRRKASMTLNEVLLDRVTAAFADIRQLRLYPVGHCGRCQRDLRPIEILYGLSVHVELNGLMPVGESFPQLYRRLETRDALQAVCPYCGGWVWAEVILMDTEKVEIARGQLLNVSVLRQWLTRYDRFSLPSAVHKEHTDEIDQFTGWMLLSRGYRTALTSDTLARRVYPIIRKQPDVWLSWWWWYGTALPLMAATYGNDCCVAQMNRSNDLTTHGFGPDFFIESAETAQVLRWGGQLSDRVVGQLMERHPGWIHRWRSRCPEKGPQRERPPFTRRQLQEELRADWNA